ncbi:polysaccharide biosynthesis/export family protein [Campylobacter porcelli]|uniref:Capsular polysaccharide export system, periplasmic protein n=1 Tax=Campylobacter porcelli TaxID=1660073 RepID=A0A1X9SUR1_9BACT|nr:MULTISPECIES: SLBB domain-containing protein [unclassified Campylobacter]ARR00005.1 capsular polysaccharide export system, periplasmic protein [Campylobacter sp. RM6137]MEE3704865.1 SLBB domain-containing protein [Campylobacter sp. CX2-8023-23]MEE3744143.1 SLBB domain-containing protein [Campylobacter sp. CX2-4855-23]MEE3776888.1 SLBB domain-containing protein [Campylobacter sp. CX2-4080-23]
MKRLLLILAIFTTSSIAAVQTESINSANSVVSSTQSSINTQDLNQTTYNFQPVQTVFGENLFNGNFTMVSQHIYNPDYILAIGDMVNVKLWGAYEFEKQLTIDSQGNIFLPKVGVIKLLGVKNSNLVATISKSVKKVFKENVHVYADMGIYQNVSVFVTGNVNRPGLYQGLSSDSLIQFIDKAGGINPQYGSFRDIIVVRNNQPYKKVDLYDFMVDGKIEMFALKNGDVILVGSVGAYMSASGEVLRSYRFEAKDKTMSLKELARLAGIKPVVTQAIVRSHADNSQIQINSYPLAKFDSINLRAGDAVEFMTDHSASEVRVNIDGEHSGSRAIVMPKGATLGDLMDKIGFNPQSNIDALQLFRKSVAKMQKNLIDSHLRELESIALTTSSDTTQEAQIRATEAKAILDFIERARMVEPKGQVVISNKDDIYQIVLQEDDTIYIPTKDNIVIVQGEVSMPGAFTHVANSDIEDYIKMAGDLSSRADSSRVILVSANGKAGKFKASSGEDVYPGDSILVLPKVETKMLQATSILTQILYQLAIAAKVVIDL